MLAIEVLMSSGSVDTVCNLRLINVILCLDLESRISFVTHRHSAGDHSHQSPKLQCQRPRFSVLCCQGRMSISLIPGLPAIPRHCTLLQFMISVGTKFETSHRTGVCLVCRRDLPFHWPIENSLP